MRKWLSIVSAACLLLSPFATFAADYESHTSTDQSPPIAQTLVREGDLAIKLAANLNLGKPTDETTAENMLATAGIAPLNGWISDYPVTPQIVGQLNDAISKAAEAGTLKISAQEASSGLNQLVAQLNLPEPAGDQTGTPGTEQTSPTVVNNYYYNEGPPIITYYPPPADYVYLYDWVPYPVFWVGFWFPGFFICHNFTTTVFVTQPFLSVNATFVTTRVIVSNRFVDPVTRRVVSIDPVVKTSAGTIRPMTTLTRSDGQSFLTVADMHRGSALRGMAPVRTGSRSGSSFGNPGARKGANAIVSRSMQAMNSPASIPYRNRGFVEQRGIRSPGRMTRPPMTTPYRAFNRTGFPRQARPMRSFSGPVMMNSHSSGPRYVNHGHWRG